MITAIACRHILLSDGITDGYVYIENGKISRLTRELLPHDTLINFGDQYLAPGLIDLHVHGAMGYDFGTCDASGAAEILDYHLSHGTTTLLPTLAAAPMAQLEAALGRLQGWIYENRIPGVHLEGPYFSPAQCGAQNTDHITPPNPDEYLPLLSKYGDIIARWSYAPERDDNLSFCKALNEAGVLASAGHTDASFQDMHSAFESGCRLITHLYSCTSTVTRKNGYRQAGVIEYAFANDDIYAEIIADGAHLPADLIRLIVKIKGRDKVALITDALSVAGSSENSGELNGVPYIVEDGVCKLPDRSAFAGSIATGDRLLRTCVQQAGLSLTDSVYMASSVPARLLGLNKGRIETGYDADLIVFDENIEIKAVMIGGKQVK